MYAEEEISRKFDSVLRSSTVIKRRVMIDPKNSHVFFGLSNFEREKEERKQYGKSIVEIHQSIQRTMQANASTQIEKDEQTKTLYQLCANPSIIHPVVLTNLYQRIDERLEECEKELENAILSRVTERMKPVCELIQFLNSVKENLTQFYRDHPFRTLELSEHLSKYILTVDVCLTPAFLPYITGKLKTPKWMVPRTVQTINEARRIYQRREYMKKEGMNLFVLMAKSSRLPFVLWKMVAEYAVDLTNLRFNLFRVISEEMLRHSQYDELVYFRSIDIIHEPCVVITV